MNADKYFHSYYKNPETQTPGFYLGLVLIIANISDSLFPPFIVHSVKDLADRMFVPLPAFELTSGHPPNADRTNINLAKCSNIERQNNGVNLSFKQ